MQGLLFAIAGWLWFAQEKRLEGIQSDVYSSEVKIKLSFELFMPIHSGRLVEHDTYFLPSKQLFWPDISTRYVVDAEDATVQRRLTDRGHRVSENVALWEKMKSRDRQQWVMFWADNFTESDFVGFVDTDTLFIAHVCKHDVFDDAGRPHVYSVFGRHANKMTATAIGAEEPFRGSEYFPFVVRTAHLDQMREHIRKQMGKITFDDAFKVFSAHHYSAADIIATYLWYYRRDLYSWRVRDVGTGPRGDVPLSQVYGTVAMHWSHEKLPYSIKETLAMGTDASKYNPLMFRFESTKYQSTIEQRKEWFDKRKKDCYNM